jgi:hypothetical protein
MCEADILEGQGLREPDWELDFGVLVDLHRISLTLGWTGDYATVVARTAYVRVGPALEIPQTGDVEGESA